MSASRVFETLPDEILLKVIHYLDIKACKALRATSTKFSTLVTPKTFSHIILYPHRLGFQQFAELAHSPLGQFVKVITLESQHVDITDRFLRQASLKSAAPGRSARRANASEVHQQRLLATHPIDFVETTALLKTCLQPLANLQQIQCFDVIIGIHGIGITPPEQIPAFYHRLYADVWQQEFIDEISLEIPRRSRFSHSAHYSWVAIAAAKVLQRPLDRLLLYNLNMEEGCMDYTRHTELLEVVLGPLRVLELSVDMNIDYNGYTSMEPLQSMLQYAKRLKTFSLRFRRIPLQEFLEFGIVYPDWHTADIGSVFQEPLYTPHRLTWSTRITALSLGGLICSLSQLTTVLSHVPLLRILALSDLVLVREDFQLSPAARPCLVTLLKIIQEMHIKAVILKGAFSNTGTQNWYIVPPGLDGMLEMLDGSSTYTLRDRTHRWLNQTGECPLEPFAVQTGGSHLLGGSATRLTLKTVENPLLHGDDSFRIRTEFGWNEHDRREMDQSSEPTDETSVVDPWPQWIPDDGYGGLAFHEMADLIEKHIQRKEKEG